MKPVPNLPDLHEALLKPMPKGFQWDFRDVHYPTSCGSAGCALGLAYELWPSYSGREDEEMAELFSMDMQTFNRIFYNFGRYYHAFNEFVKPSMVAAKIKKFMDENDHENSTGDAS